jgi:hypothetical protein
MMFFARLSSARPAAGALLLLAAGAALPAEPIRIATERPTAPCPAGRVLGLLRVDAETPATGGAERCVVLLVVRDLSDAALDEAAATAARWQGLAGAIVEFEKLPESASPEFALRVPFAAKKLASAIRAASPDAEVGFDLTAAAPAGGDLVLSDEGLGPYADALVLRAGRGRVSGAEISRRWLLTPLGGASAAGEVIRLFQSALAPPASVTLLGLLDTGERRTGSAESRSLERLQAYWTGDASLDPTPTRAKRADGTAFDVLRFFDAKAFAPFLLLAEDAAGRVEIELSGGAYAKASVENLETGARRDFDLAGARSLVLDLSKGPLAVRLHLAARPGGEAKASVEVGAARGLTAEEIVARERVWDAGQREKVKAFVAQVKTSLRFRVAEVNETFDLTIQGPLFVRRGEPADWAWHEFYLNGVKWKGATLPRIPILQPEKVTTLPLDIRLTEDYDYALKGETTIAGRRAYHVVFTPKQSLGEKPIYRGSAWIDAETFALLRRESIQLNLKGETLSNVQTEFYRSVRGQPDIVLPLEIRGEQVFSTAGRTTAIERDVRMTEVQVNPSDFDVQRQAAYASDRQMVRDTDKGLRYLVPDPERPAERIVEENVNKKSLFGLLGTFYDPSFSYPLPLAGVQYFDFDLWKKGKQLSIFFGGALMSLNYTDPALAGSRFDLGVDLFGVAFPFGDTSYRSGQEVKAEKIKNLTEFGQINIGHPIGPYLKASLSLFSKWNDFQRDKDTGPTFVTPSDTLTDGAELRLVANFQGFNARAAASYSHRVTWEPWGDPATSEYNPDQRNYWKYSLSIAKDQYFPGFRKLHVEISYLDGSRLDRFSKYEFGAFSGNPVHGFKSGSLRTERALLATVSYGLNIENIIRFEGFYDQVIASDKVSGFHNSYFSGAGLLASLNGPLKNSLLRCEIGVPVVRHGVNGFVVNALLLKLF